MLLQDEPPQGHLDRRGEARREEVGWQLGVHGQRLVEGARRQLDAVLVRDRLRRRRGLRREHLRQSYRFFYSDEVTKFKFSNI